jgi:hypothetical protein
LSAIVVALSVALLRSPILAGGDSPTTVQQLVVLLPFLGVIVVRLTEPSARAANHLRLALTALLLVVTVVAGWRAIGPQTGYSNQRWLIDGVTYAVAGSFAYCVFVRDANIERVRTARLALVFAPAIYVAANVLLRGLDITPQSRTPPETLNPGQMLGWLGTSHLRTFFPLSSGVNSFGIFAGLAFSGCFILAVRASGWVRLWAGMGAGLGVYAILVADARGSMAASLTAVAVVWLLSKRFGRSLGRLGLLIPVSPILVLGALALLSSSALSGDVEGRGSFASGSNRLYIWEPVFDSLGHFSIKQLFGFGAYGQISSGVAEGYAYLFQGYTVVPGTHNLMFQTILDTGYLGLVLLVAVFALTISSLAGTQNKDLAVTNALLAVMIYFVFIGFTEAVPTVYSIECHLLFLMVLIASARTAGSADSVRPAQLAPQRPDPRST